MMKFRSHVEPPEPMKGSEVPPDVVEALGGGKRPAVTITINGHSWKSRVAIMRGRYLLGLSNANRRAAGVVTGDEVEVEVEIDAEPRVVVEPPDFARALDADPVARTAYDRLSYSRKREHVLAIESAKKAETPIRLIEEALAMLQDQESAGGRAARAKTRGDYPCFRGDHACGRAMDSPHRATRPRGAQMSGGKQVTRPSRNREGRVTAPQLV
jgi:Bacteriocin-protection, YdeI or OmpD-Associated/Domain of unknown function (DUF1905)